MLDQLDVGTEGLNIDLEALLEPKVQIGDIHFVINKMKAMEAYDLMDDIRLQVAQSAGMPMLGIGDSLDEQSSWILSLIAMVMGFDKQFVERVRRRLFQRIEFLDPHSSSNRVLAGNEDIAFAGLEPLVVYELIVRSLAINFTASLRSLGSMFQIGPQNSE